VHIKGSAYPRARYLRLVLVGGPCPQLQLKLILQRCDNTYTQRQQLSTAGAMNGYPPPMAPLAPVSAWKATKTKEGKEYYFNATTGVTTWEKPEELWDDVEVCAETILLEL
jgi:hypothetical protein